MKRMMIGVALAVFTLGAAHAQDKQDMTPAERAKHQTERMTKELGLNAEQVTKVQAINAKYAEQAEAVRKERRANAESTKGKGAELQDARMEDLKAVLDAEQYEKLVAKQEAMKERRMEQRKGKRQDMRGTKKE
ncbi:MAG: hypothetical protein K8H89_04035 [Flavobacteriales bacterium]|jgi:hypothetical protein|nr:hypothetical protein [Flavobacteriales bacterium]MCB0758394.1 hypothetical protein [Flavobacteriales bacterium]